MFLYLAGLIILTILVLVYFTVFSVGKREKNVNYEEVIKDYITKISALQAS